MSKQASDAHWNSGLCEVTSCLFRHRVHLRESAEAVASGRAGSHCAALCARLCAARSAVATARGTVVQDRSNSHHRASERGRAVELGQGLASFLASASSHPLLTRRDSPVECSGQSTLSTEGATSHTTLLCNPSCTSELRIRRDCCSPQQLRAARAS